MLANFLNKSKPINFIGLIVFFFIGYLFTLVTSFFVDGFSNDKILESIFLPPLFLIIFFVFNFISSRNKLTKDNSFAFFVFTSLCFSVLPEILNYRTVSLLLLYLLFLRKVYSLRSSNNVLGKIFDSGFWLGVLFLIEPQAILFLMLIYFAIYIHQKITIHTLLTPIIGFITPLFIYFTYFFWIDKTEEFTKLFKFDVSFNLAFYLETKYYWITLFALVLSFFSIIFKSIKALSINNTFRRSWVLMMLHFLLIIVFLLVLNNKNGSEIVFALFSIAVFLANGIEIIQKKLLKNLVLYAILVGCIAFYFLL